MDMQNTAAQHSIDAVLVAAANRSGTADMRSIVITGVTSGIGYATARLFIERGYRVFGSVRRNQDGARLHAELGPHFIPLYFDVRDEAAVVRSAGQVAQRLQGGKLSALINNAGTSVLGPLLYQSIDDIREQIDTNLVGPLIVTKAFAPLLGTVRNGLDAPGRVINMSSICGKIGSPFGVAYCASKHGVEGLSESLRRELMVHGIAVIIVAPGVTKTPIWDKISDQALARIDTTPFGRPFRKAISALSKSARRHGLEPDRVALAVWHAAVDRSPKLRYAPAHPILEHGIAGLLPRRLMDRLIDRRLRLSTRAPSEQETGKNILDADGERGT